MREFLDTSVLVAALVGDHPSHEASEALFRKAERQHSSCAAHSIAETYATLTRLPVTPRIGPEQAMLLVNDVRQRLTAVTLSEAEYYQTAERLANQGMSGGRIYDTLLLACAAKAKAAAIYTWNVKDFRSIRPDLADKIRTP